MKDMAYDRSNWIRWGVLLLLCVVFIGLGSAEVWAADEDCTTHPDMMANDAAGQGIVSAVMGTIIGLLENTSEKLYETVLLDGEFVAARNAVLLLAVAIYGVMVTFNMVNFRPGEIFSLIFKLGVVVMMTNPGAWATFDQFVGQFFFGTMLEMIEIFMGQTSTASTGGYQGQGNISGQLGEPLKVLNWPMARILSTQFFITVIGVFFMPPYGWIMAGLLVWGAFMLVMALFGALFTYIKSIVGLWFLFALAPIFFLLLLFRRTANLFEGWLNMVVSFTLQPILLFAFLSFFMIILSTSLGKLMNVTWCWTEVANAQQGMGVDWMMWRPMNVNGTNVAGGIWGLIDHARNNKGTGMVFPIDSMDVLFFLLSSYVAWQYSTFVSSLATELSNNGLRISVNAEAARNFFSSRGWTPGQVAAKGLTGGAKWMS